MNKKRFVGLCVILVCACSIGKPSEVMAQAAPDPAAFRQVLLEFANKYDPASSDPSALDSLSAKIQAASDNELLDLYSQLPDPVRLVAVIETLIDMEFEPSDPVPFSAKMSSSDLQMSQVTVASSFFAPNYPTGPDYTFFVVTGVEIPIPVPGFPNISFGGLTLLNILQNGPQNRTNANKVAFWMIVWEGLNYAGAALQGACDTAPSGDIFQGQLVACPLATAAWLAADYVRITLNAVEFQDRLIDGAEIEAAYENSKIIIDDLSFHDTDIKNELGNHDASIKTKLSLHDTNITNQLSTHDASIKTKLSLHDTNIANRLSTHDTEIKNLLSVVQGTLDNKVELRKVHINVLEIVNRQRYLVATTDGGQPVDVIFEAIEVFDDKAASFVTLLPDASVSAVEAGIYLVDLNLGASSPDKIFRLRVRHKDVVDHFGQILFHRTGE